MVNGLPGSGKTTLADAIGTAAGVPLYSKDVLKVAIAQAYGYADDAAEQSRAVGAAAMEAVWTLLAEVPAAVVDSWWEPSSRRFVEAGLERCGQPDVLEVWCDVSADLARERFARRDRHPILADAQRLDDNWKDWALDPHPLGVGDVRRVRTDRPLSTADRDAIVAFLTPRRPMRAVVITEFGGPEVLEVREVPDPEPAAGEVLVDVAATAINRADILQRQGNYKVPEGASPYPGLECSGTIAALGEGVTGWQVGDEICALLTGGGYAERVAVPAGQLLPVPQGLSLIEAAALPETACTVWSMVFDIGRLQPGETFLVHGGSSGIGTLAIQLAHRHGTRVFTTAGTQRKVDVCRQLGADVAINYREQDFVEVIKADSGGVDVILDNMGAVYLARNVDALAVEGRLVVLGLQGGRQAELDLGMLLSKRASVSAATLRARPAGQKAGIVAATAAFVWPSIEAGEVRPVIDRVLPLDQVAEAHRCVEASEHIGKVVLRVR